MGFFTRCYSSDLNGSLAAAAFFYVKKDFKFPTYDKRKCESELSKTIIVLLFVTTNDSAVSQKKHGIDS